MIVRQIHTALEHEVNGRTLVGSFMILEEMNDLERQQMLEMTRARTADTRTLAYVLDSEYPSELLPIFVSVDGNFFVARHLSMDWQVMQVNPERDLLTLPYEISGTLPELLRELRLVAEKDPELSSRLFKRAKLTSGKIPNRISFRRYPDANFEATYRKIEDCLADPSSASDDILGFTVIMDRKLNMFDADGLAKCRNEIKVRFARRFHKPGEYFDFEKVSLAEIELRRDRAKDSLVKFINKFPADFCVDKKVVQLREWEWEVANYIRSLSDDVLAELLLAHFGTFDPKSERASLLYSLATDRIHGF
jgi:hypothetical protein